MAFWVYILRCADGRFYTGHTDDLERRIAQHQAGQGGDFTRRRRPIALAWADTTTTREEALAMERRLKPWSRAKKEAWIAGDFTRLSHFARPPAERASTALGTTDDVILTTSDLQSTHTAQTPFVPSAVEARAKSTPTASRPSTALGTNGTMVAGQTQGRRS